MWRRASVCSLRTPFGVCSKSSGDPARLREPSRLRSSSSPGEPYLLRWSATVMRRLAIVLATGGVLLLAFGFWGTHGGLARFGDGLVPIACGAAGGLLLIAGVIADMAVNRRIRKQRHLTEGTEVTESSSSP